MQTQRDRGIWVPQTAESESSVSVSSISDRKVCVFTWSVSRCRSSYCLFDGILAGMTVDGKDFTNNGGRVQINIDCVHGCFPLLVMA